MDAAELKAYQDDVLLIEEKARKSGFSIKKTYPKSKDEYADMVIAVPGGQRSDFKALLEKECTRKSFSALEYAENRDTGDTWEEVLDTVRRRNAHEKTNKSVS